MKKTFTKLILTSIGFMLGTQAYSQCLEMTTAATDTVIADPGTCGAVYNYSNAVGHACGMYADFENGFPAGWTTGILGSTQDSWTIQDVSGAPGLNPLGSMMCGVPHTGNGTVEYSYLQTPIFDATGGGEFFFDFYCDSETGTYDQEIIEISYDGGTVWVQMIGNQLPNDPVNIQSTSFLVDPLDGTATTTVRFTYNTWDGCCGSQNGFFVDNVYFEYPGTTVTQIAGLASGSTFPVGTTTNTFVAVAGVLADTSSFDVTVLDTLAPVVTAPADTISCGIVVDGIAPVVADDCPTAVDFTLSGATTGAGTDDASGSTFNPGVTTVTYVATDSSGNADSASFTVTVNASLGSETASSCLSYTWPTDGMTYTSTGSYTATLVNSLGCDSVVTLDLTIDTVDVNVSVSGIELTADFTGATSYQWLDCDNSFAPISGETSQSMTATANGNYAVMIDDAGCVDTSACVAITQVGISNNLNAAFEVYPNPTTGQLTVNFGSTYDNVALVLRNIAGETIAVYNIENSNQINMDIEAAKGVYLLEVITSDGQSNIIKVIKE